MFEDRTPEVIKKEALEEAAAYGSGLSTVEGSFLDTLFGPAAMMHWKVLQAINAVLPIAFVDETSGPYIDKECDKVGITRKEGARARAVMTLSGKTGVTVPAGTVFCTADGLEFELMEAVTLTGDGDTGTAEAVEAGSAYNVSAGELNQMVRTVPGLDAWTNAAAEGGTDRESDRALVARLNAYRQKPSTSGNIHDYENWAMEVEGVGAAKVIPLWNGPGTVKVLVVDAGLGPAAEQTVAAVAANIEDKRPIGAEVAVESAKALTVTVAATVVLDGSVTLADVRTAYRDKLDGYLKGLVFSGRTVLYNRTDYLLLDIPGVLDYTALTINGGTANVAVGEDQVPVLGEVTLS